MLEAAVFDTKAQDCLPGQYQRQSKFGDDDITVRVGLILPCIHEDLSGDLVYPTLRRYVERRA